MRPQHLILCTALLAAAPAWAAAPAQVDAARLAAADRDPANWMSYGRTYGEQRFSPLGTIDAGNVGKLGLAWYADLEIPRGQEATPLVVDGVMYVSTAWDLVKAFDAATGKLLWSYDPKVPRRSNIKVCCDAVSRGVALWEGRVYLATIDGRLVALDAATGTPVWSVLTVDPSLRYTITQAPRVIRGKVVIGNSGSEFGVRGYVSAYDAGTGALAWRFYTVPGDPAQPPEAPILATAARTWHGEWWKAGGGATVWNGMSYDPELDLLYVGTGNGVDWNEGDRSPGGGDNLFVASIVALHGATGAYAWHYQVTPGDEWDYDATEDLVQADLTIAGTPRKVLMQASKNGFFYVLDRATGALLSADPFVPVTWASGVDLKTGRPAVNPEARYDATGKTWVGSPGPMGAHAWEPMAFSAQTGLVYIPTNETSFPYIPDPHYQRQAMATNFGLDTAAASLAQDPESRRKALAGLKGYLLAWDPVRRKEAWRAMHRGPWNGGVLATAGNLVFQGSAAGEFLAYRADTGARLWSMDAQSAVMAGPMAYAVGGEEYVAVLAGWGGSFPLTYGALATKSGNERNISRVLVFKLGGTAALPPAPPETVLALDPPPATADAATVETGKRLFARFCGTCHGDAVIAGGLTPDLRYSTLLGDDGWFDVVLGGRLQDEGMVSFAPSLDHEAAAAIRAYVTARANEDKAREAKAAP